LPIWSVRMLSRGSTRISMASSKRSNIYADTAFAVDKGLSKNPNQGSGIRKKTHKTNYVRHDSGCNEQGRGNQYDGSVNEFRPRHLTGSQLLIQFCPYCKALLFCHVRAEQSRRQNQSKCLEAANKLAQLDQQIDFDGWKNNK